MITVTGSFIEGNDSWGLSMLPSYYPQRRGEYIYDVTVTKDDSVPLTHRCRAHLKHTERVEGGRLTRIPVDVPDTLRSYRP